MDPSKLPPDSVRSAHFRTLIEQLVQKFGPLQIFHFSKISSTENREGCFIGEETLFQCHFCLLLVTELATRIDYEVQDFANANCYHGTITVISLRGALEDVRYLPTCGLPRNTEYLALRRAWKRIYGGKPYQIGGYYHL